MRTIQIHPLSLAVGAIAVSAAFVLSAQTTAPAQTTWPPPKSMILNVFEQPSPSISVPPGGSVVVLTVPADRWLTITGACAFIGSGSGYSPQLYWAEQQAGGAVVRKGGTVAGWPSDLYGSGSWFSGAPDATPAGCSGPLGWTFAPGSSVLLSSATAYAQPVTAYSLIGYYSRN